MAGATEVTGGDPKAAFFAGFWLGEFAAALLEAAEQIDPARTP
jgi:hypothetical protein